MKERFRAKNPKSMMLRFHTQTAGSTLTAQQPDLNVVRVAIQALAAVLGGTQSLHTNGADEALGLPTEDAARLALRTQQIIAYESGVTREPDPLGGSDYVEKLGTLYQEFAESNQFSGRTDGPGIFTSADDLRRKTPVFWEKYVLPKIENDFLGLYKLLNNPGGANYYLDRIWANIRRLEGEMSAPATAAL